MKISRLLAAIAMVVLLPFLAACGGSSGDAQTSAAAAATGPQGGEGLSGFEWMLTSAGVDAADLPSFNLTIAFTDKDVNGFSGVNRFAGGYTATPDGTITMGPLAATMMAGPDDAMAAETAYLAALESVTGYTVTDSQLVLYVDEQELLTYAKGEPLE